MMDCGRMVWKVTLAFLTVGVLLGVPLSCSRSTNKSASTNSQTKEASAPTSDQSNEQQKAEALVPPETVRSEEVRIEMRVKMVTVGNAQGHYRLSCHTDVDSCVTPEPGKDYLLFTKTTRWRFPGAKEPMTLAWLQNWLGAYTNEENIALMPADKGDRTHTGMYWLRSWEKSK